MLACSKSLQRGLCLGYTKQIPPMNQFSPISVLKKILHHTYIDGQYLRVNIQEYLCDIYYKIYFYNKIKSLKSPSEGLNSSHLNNN